MAFVGISDNFEILSIETQLVPEAIVLADDTPSARHQCTIAEVVLVEVFEDHKRNLQALKYSDILITQSYLSRQHCNEIALEIGLSDVDNMAQFSDR